ncbi:MAG: DUF1566 domain-containing protein [Gammaproteobacteria bacterium]|nr:DUF1566 domain-containing protein [Gammaproteobacteria bacterium]
MKHLSGILLLFVFTSADAALLSRAGGAAYYDTVLDLTWLADTNWAQTSSYDADGLMTWNQAQTWVSTLNTGAGHLGTTDWRLPTVTDSGTPGCNYAFEYTDCGYNVDTSTGEMASLFYDSLGNLAYLDGDGIGPQPGWGLTETGPFTNFQPYLYWSGTEYVTHTDFAWGFDFYNGNQFSGDKLDYYNAWAVRSGDIAAVPVPAAAWLFGSALMGLVSLRRVRSRVNPVV